MEVTIEMKASPGKGHELYLTLQALLPTIRGQKNCLDCRISMNIEDSESFFVAVDWDSQEGLERYAHSGSCSALLGAVDLLSLEARVRIGRDSPWEGIDRLKRMRRKA